MAKEPGQESKVAGQDDPLYKAWLSNGLEHLRRVFGRHLAGVLVALAFALLVMLAVSFVYGLIWYLNPIFGANDNLSTTDRKDLVQGFASVAQAAAVGLAGAVGLVGLFFTWRSLRQARESQAQTQENTQRTLELTEQGQITERFTRAIDQLGATDETTGKPKLEIRLGGIYALERIARDSPERDYSTVVEVLTAYVRENAPRTPRPSNGSSEAASFDAEATAEAAEGAKQPTPPKPGRLTADIQAILDMLRRAQDRVPEEYRTRLYLHEADLRGAILQIADLREAVLFRANLQGALLGGTNLQGANLGGAILKGANLGGVKLGGADLREADLREADLRGADVRRADLRGADLRGATLFLSDIQGANFQGAKVTDEDRGDLAFTPFTQGAIMPDGQKYEDWLKDKKGSGKDVENE
jgi:hypothetical protein